jgi:hypothetical protein
LCALWHLTLVLNGEGTIVDTNFKNEVFSSYHPNPTPSCGKCGQRPSKVMTMLNPDSGKTVRMFRCDCGEQTWTERNE